MKIQISFFWQKTIHGVLEKCLSNGTHLNFITPHNLYVKLKLNMLLGSVTKAPVCCYGIIYNTKEILNSNASWFDDGGSILTVFVQMYFITRWRKDIHIKQFFLSMSPLLAVFKDDSDALAATNASRADSEFATPTSVRQKIRSQLLNVTINRISGPMHT